MAARSLALIGAGVLLLFLPGTGGAHDHAGGDASWIQANPDLKGSDGVPCCGPQDCFEADGVELTAEGATLRLNNGFTVSVPARFPATYQSNNASWWVCIYADGTPRCAFRPVSF